MKIRHQGAGSLLLRHAGIKALKNSGCEPFSATQLRVFLGFLAHPGRLRDGEWQQDNAKLRFPPRRRVRDGEQPLALLFLLLCPRRRRLLFNLFGGPP